MPMIRYKPEQIDLGDRRHIPANKTDRRMAALALFDLDWLCRNSQFFDLAAEFLSPPNGSLDTSRRMSFQSCARDVCNQGCSVSTFVTCVTAIGVRFLNPES